jgi:hypothetical protein
VDQQLQLASAFLHEARQALDRIDGGGPDARDSELRQQRRDAMTYWIRADRHYRACHAAHDQPAAGSARQA